MIIIIIIIIIIVIIGLSGIQFGLLSYKWLIQSDDCEVGVSYINVNTKSCYQFIKTMTIWERSWMYWLCIFITRCAHDTCYRLIQAWCINCPITLFRQKHDTYNVLFMLKLGWWWPITLEYFVIVSIEMLYHLSRTPDKLFHECYEKALFSWPIGW